MRRAAALVDDDELEAPEAPEERATPARFVLAIYRRPRVVARRFEAVGNPDAVRADAERALTWYAARRVTIRTADGRYLEPVLKAAPAYDWSTLLKPPPVERKRPATARTPDPAPIPPSKPSPRKRGC